MPVAVVVHHPSPFGDRKKAKSHMEEQPWKLVYKNTGPQINLDNPERIKESQDIN